MTPHLLAFDLGQTGCRIRVISDGGAVAYASGRGFRAGTNPDEAIAEIARVTAEQTGIARFDRIVGGMTGRYGVVPDITTVAKTLRRAYGTHRAVIADDALTSYLGARGNIPGVVAAIGTGLVALGTNGETRWARVDGASAMAGDDGAGWWIGRQGLIAALSAYDGRDGGSAELMAAAEARIGPIRDVPRLINSSPAPIAAVAQFADAVAETARSGDPVSSAIFARAGEYIGRAIVAAARRAGLASPVPYTLIGGIATAADQFDAALTAHLSARLGVCLRQAPAGDGLDGAVALAGVARIENFSGLASVSQVG